MRTIRISGIQAIVASPGPRFGEVEGAEAPQLERSSFGQGDHVAADDDQVVEHSDVDERHRLGGRNPPVLARIVWTKVWGPSNSLAIACSVSPSRQRSHISAFWVSV